MRHQVAVAGVLAGFIGIAIAMLACSGALAADSAQGTGVEVRDAWIRWLPAGAPGAGYMTLINSGSVEQALVGASSPDFGEISFHRTHLHEGMSMMEPVEAVMLKPNVAVRFAEGGYHLMLMQPKRSLHPGDKVTITLRLRGGATIAVPFDVRAAE